MCSPMWSSGEDPALSPPWPGFDSPHGRLDFFFLLCSLTVYSLSGIFLLQFLAYFLLDELSYRPIILYYWELRLYMTLY